MRQKSSEERVNLLHPKARDKFKTALEKAEVKFPKNIAIGIPQGLRTIDEQNDIYAQGRTKPGKIVTNAKGGSSFHNYGLAIDFAILYDKDGNGTYETLSWDMVKDMDRDGEADWMEVVKSLKADGFEWGGDWHSIKDNPHFQLTFGYSWQSLYKKYTNKDFIPGTKYVNI